MTVSLPSRQPAGYRDITSPFALDDEAFQAAGRYAKQADKGMACTSR
jgi:hypothetical protein